MLFELYTKEPSEIEVLVTKHIKSGTKTTHLDGAISHNPELILRLGENDGSGEMQGPHQTRRSCPEIVNLLLAPRVEQGVWGSHLGPCQAFCRNQ